jgi:hypothetical protein
MKKQLSILACAFVIGFGALSSNAWAQAKTAKACTEEWRADKAGFQAKGITEKAYVADCRAGTASAPAAAPAPAPTAAAPRPLAPNARATAGQKTAKVCTEEWRADKAGFQAKGITEKAYVADCRTGTAPTPTAAPAPAPTAAAPTPSPIAPTPAAAPGQKTAKACTEEWRADKAGFQAKGITEKAYVAACRGGTVATPATAPAPTTAGPAPAPAPTAAAPAPSPSASRPSAQTPYGTTERGPSTGSPSGAGQFANEAQAKATCPGDTVVWVNLRSKIYHFAGTHNYGNTKDGAYMCERDTATQGMRAAKNEEHP